MGSESIFGNSLPGNYVAGDRFPLLRRWGVCSLARGGVRRGELAVSAGPDALDAATGTDEEGGGSQRDKCHQ